jgi:hypothetical protein
MGGPRLKNLPAPLVAVSPSMFIHRKIGRPCTGSLHLAVWTVLHFHAISRGRPALTESKRAIASSSTASGAASAAGGAKLAFSWNYLPN